MKKPALVVMAAGMGSRYGGLKQIDPVDKEGDTGEPTCLLKERPALTRWKMMRISTRVPLHLVISRDFFLIIRQKLFMRPFRIFTIQ